ncbi:hypothetical protein GWD52_12035 [Enterobacteriaceae bacterium 4M9]|nr:hypothetical protein [Enterobacteriaceae bacterium 4M9]
MSPTAAARHWGWRFSARNQFPGVVKSRTHDTLYIATLLKAMETINSGD